MPPDKQDSAWLWDMLRHAKEVVGYVDRRTWEDYQRDGQFRRAVERCVLIIGEAARNVSKSFQAAHPEIEWRAIVVQRHRLVHEYDEIIDEKIWSVAKVHVPILIQRLGELIPQPPPDPLPEQSDDDQQPDQSKRVGND